MVIGTLSVSPSSLNWNKVRVLKIKLERSRTLRRRNVQKQHAYPVDAYTYQMLPINTSDMRIAEIMNATQSLLTPLPEAANNVVVLYHLTPTKNVPQIMRGGLIPKIGTRSRLLKETVPAIYLFNSIEDAEYAIENWYGNQFGETTKIALLAVTVPIDATEITGADYERILTSPIPPANIKVLDPNFGY